MPVGAMPNEFLFDGKRAPIALQAVSRVLASYISSAARPASIAWPSAERRDLTPMLAGFHADRSTAKWLHIYEAGHPKGSCRAMRLG